MSVNSKMTALADEIRELSGTSEAMGLDAMKAHVGEANDEISTQSTLLSEQDAKIAELAQVLAGKAGGGGGSIETIALDCSDMVPEPGLEIFYIDETMTFRSEELWNTTYTIVKNSIFAISGYPSTTIGGYSSIIGNSMCRIFLATK